VRRHRRRLRLVALIIVIIAVSELIPWMLGHDQAALSAEIVTSDATSALSDASPFGHNPSQFCGPLLARFGVGNHLLKDKPFGFYASVWPSYQALTAMYVGSLLPHPQMCGLAFDQTLMAIDDNYWNHSADIAAAYDQGPRAFHIGSDLPRVDDSLWMGMALMQQYARAKDQSVLGQAEAVFRLAVRNWDQQNGGVYWQETGAGNSTRAVVSNAPAVILGIEIFQQVHDPWYLGWSERIMAWLTRTLRDPATGLYNDHIGGEASPTAIDPAKYTYTQGVMVCALAMMSEVESAQYPLSNSVELADKAMAYFPSHQSYGQPGFDVIWVESVLWLSSLDRNVAFRAKAESTLALVRSAEPKNDGELLTASSEMALRELVGLPRKEDHQLLCSDA
jgi:uncharacterized protein YyaL (SSP411 family)